MVGNQIATLVDGAQENGTHSVNLNPVAYNLAPGVYFCTIEVNTGTDHYSKTTKMILTK
jgi:predicted HAD superfamily phosphohydrolase YqeG